jgi:hypothetical protein
LFCVGPFTIESNSLTVAFPAALNSLPATAATAVVAILVSDSFFVDAAFDPAVVVCLAGVFDWDLDGDLD